jgi:uncharacterized protein
MATTDVYQLGWEAGVDRLLLTSVGSGNSTGAGGNLSPQEMNILYHASRVPAALLAAAQQEQDFLCRIFGETLEGEPLDSEIGDMRAVVFGTARSYLVTFVTMPSYPERA